MCPQLVRQHRRRLHRLGKHSQNVGSSMFFLFFFGFSDKSLFDFVGCSEKAQNPHGCWDGTICCFQTRASCRGRCGRYITLILWLESRGSVQKYRFFLYILLFFFHPCFPPYRLSGRLNGRCNYDITQPFYHHQSRAHLILLSSVLERTSSQRGSTSIPP
jgi:hypothetical protein